MDAKTLATAGRTSARSLFTVPLDVLVLMGGPSTEREVSLVSGLAVAEALASAGHRVRQGDIDPDDLSALEGPRPDVVFIAMHGRFGEDGQVQRLCQQRGLAYVGSGPEACARAMDKVASKHAYRQAGLLTPDWVVLNPDQPPAEQARALESLGLPCVLKPIDGGSSVDVAIARQAQVRDLAAGELLDRYGRCMGEPFIAGRELTVGVLGEQALPVIEIRPKRSFYDYAAKYADDATEYVLEHNLPPRTVEQLQAAALGAHRALGCRDMSRTDFLLDAAGQGWILETNAIPGFTGHSLLPKAAARIGLSFPRLCERLIQMALERHS